MDKTTEVEVPSMCEWFARCGNRAEFLIPHPVLGAVPCCKRCADKLDLQPRFPLVSALRALADREKR